MNPIGGNIRAKLQIKISSTKNEIGESIPAWETVHTLTGFLDLMSGDSRYNTYDSKIAESTHVFLCDYVPLDSRVNTENARFLINNERYDVTFIDNPMNLNYHYEFFLKYTGGQ